MSPGRRVVFDLDPRGTHVEHRPGRSGIARLDFKVVLYAMFNNTHMKPRVARLRAAVIKQTRGPHGEFRSNNPDVCLFHMGVQEHPGLPRVLQMAAGLESIRRLES